MNSKVIILDDKRDQFNKLKAYLTTEGYTCMLVQHRNDLITNLKNAQRSGDWYDFVMIDFDLSVIDSTDNGISVYESISHDFPNETYIIYTSQDRDSFRTAIDRLRYRDVELVILDEVLKKKNIRLSLVRLLQQKQISNSVFLVHGRNVEKANKVKKLLSDGFGLDVLSWNDAIRVAQNEKYIFEIVLKGINESHLTVVLFTDDEALELRPDLLKPEDLESIVPGLKRWQSRPNVYIEAGYAMGIRPKRTLFVEWLDNSQHFSYASDFAGMHTVRFTDSPAKRSELKERLEITRCKLNLQPAWATMPLI